MEFAYSCGLTEYSTAWLEIWILYSWTAGKGEGKLGELSPEGQWESMWVVVALYGEWAYRCHARQWRDITSEGREGLEDQENGTEKTSAQDSVEKGALCSPGEGPRESIYWKMLKVSLCASDFSSQRQKWGGGGVIWGTIFANCVDAIWWERGKKIQHVSESSLGLQMLIALGTVSLHSCRKVFLKHLSSTLNLKRIGRCSLVSCSMTTELHTVFCCCLDNEVWTEQNSVYFLLNPCLLLPHAASTMVESLSKHLLFLQICSEFPTFKPNTTKYLQKYSTPGTSTCNGFSVDLHFSSIGICDTIGRKK